MPKNSINKLNNLWNLNFSAWRHITNKQEKFCDFRSKNYKSIMVKGKVISSQEIGTIYFFIQIVIIILLNVTQILKYYSNLL